LKYILTRDFINLVIPQSNQFLGHNILVMSVDHDNPLYFPGASAHRVENPSIDSSITTNHQPKKPTDLYTCFISSSHQKLEARQPVLWPQL
jgi:hypothetical protein